MNALDFTALLADLHGLSNLSIGLSIASTVLGAVESEIETGDKVVQLQFDGRLKVFCFFDKNNHIKETRVLLVE